ncbi:C2H2-type zinc finger protein [Aspergillus brunneoviolaceus CBS 621.78]|uniref:Uncharacterized protein n=1 Tax=Aspergillus brunneoviolaceus CBS 621.78 TaxID=1450534 RepID=A0ACD1G575_9EURO|nr:hypothetical protein BO95DRAFT_483410 [Aspergillus brunneoviolaceus CBS 621.78]RAH44299.1 hypothetical protein BO95DRAFT_483410 [Aspergillus brunneoviolaceus CBS 621.78]
MYAMSAMSPPMLECPPMEHSYSTSSEESMQSTLGYMGHPSLYGMVGTEMSFVQPTYEPSSYDSTPFSSPQTVASSTFDMYYPSNNNTFTASPMVYSPEAYSFHQLPIPASSFPVPNIEWIPTQSSPNPEVVYSPVESYETLDASKPVKPYTCEDCNKAFTRPADLKRHQTSVHNPVFQDCPVQECLRKDGNGFPRRDHLIEHLRSFHHWDVPKRRAAKRAKTA